MNDILKLAIEGHFEIRDQNGLVILSKKNLVVNTAKSIMASALVGHSGGDYIAYISFGNGTTAPLITNRALDNQIYQTPVAYDSPAPPHFEDQTESDLTITPASNVVFSGIVDENSTFDTTEAGLFSIKEFMFSRITFQSINKPMATQWLVRWTLKLRIV